MTTTAIEPKADVENRAFLDCCEVRAIDKEARTATFVAATENGVETFFGREFLRMGGGDFERFRKNPVVLDTHNRWEAGAVIGRAEITTEGRKLIAEVTFAETERAEEIWLLVAGGFLRALSVGFRARETQTLEDGETSGAGKNRIEGPARIVKQWELFEISVVPVPADSEALRRSFFGKSEAGELLAEVRRLTEAITEREDSMSSEPKDKASEQKPPGDGLTELQVDKTAELESRPLEDLRRDVAAITPRGLEDVAEACLMKGMDLEKTRAALIEAHAMRAESVGTSEPATKPSESEGGDGERELKDVSDLDLTRALCG